MTFKKISAVLLVLAMLATMCCISVAAAGTSFELKLSKDVYTNDVFTADLFVTTDAASLRMCEVTFTYDSTVIVPVDEAGAEANRINKILIVDETYGEDFVQAGQKVQAGSINYAGIADYQNGVETVAAPTADKAIYSFRFKALKAGSTGLTVTKFTYLDTASGTPATLADSTATNNTAADIKVLSMPTEPSVSGLSISGTVIEGATIEAAYTFNNGNTDEGADTTTGDASVVTWTIGDATATGKTLALTKDMVGKEVKFAVEPKVDRELKPAGAKAELAAAVVVKAKADYVPTAEVTLPAELIATVSYEPTVVADNTYALATDASTYAWYVVEAENLEGALAAELGEAVAATKATSFGADVRDKYAVVVVTPVVTVAGDTFTGTAVKAAALIKGEPPVVDASAIKTDKELNVNKAIKVVEGKDFTAESKAPTSDELTIEYAWYVATAEELGEFTTEGKDAVSTTNSYKPAKEDLGKYVILYITATDALGIATTVEVKYDLAIVKAAGSAPAASSSPSLVTGKTEEPKDEEPKVDVPVDEPETDEPSGEPIANGAAAFTDVDKEAYAWAYDSIDVLAKAGVIKGMSETTFEPEATATNAQVIALVVRIAGLTAEDAKTEKVDAEHWVAAELAVADAKGILSVYGDKVATEEAITREYAFTLLYNAIKAAGVELKEDAEAIEYSDAASIDAACAEAITALTKAGIVNGMGDGTLAPKATITRAQLAKILGMANALIAK